MSVTATGNRKVSASHERLRHARHIARARDLTSHRREPSGEITVRLHVSPRGGSVRSRDRCCFAARRAKRSMAFETHSQSSHLHFVTSGASPHRLCAKLSDELPELLLDFACDRRLKFGR